MADYPKCFPNSKEFEAYVEVCDSDESGLPSARLSFCDYCKADFQLEMIEKNRCENPEFDIQAAQIEDNYQMELVLLCQ